MPRKLVMQPRDLSQTRLPFLLFRCAKRLTAPMLCVVGVAAPRSVLAESALNAPLTFDAFDRQRDAPPNEDPNYHSDGVYGRFDGEISLVPMVGTQWTQAGWLTQLGVSAYYLDTIGVAFRSSDGNWSAWKPRADVNVSTLSLALRPLFLLRWTQDLERGPRFLDLAIDSLTLKVGSFWSQQHSADVQHVGAEFELSFGLPILAKAHGPWVTWSALTRWPKVTHADSRMDLALGLALEWSFSLGN